MFPPTELRVPGMLHSPRSRRTSRRGGSNCIRLESQSRQRLTGQRAGVRSIFVTRQAMWLSWLRQPFGVAAGSFDSDDAVQARTNSRKAAFVDLHLAGQSFL